MKSLSLLFVLAFSVLAERTFVVTNNCPYTVWPAIFTDPKAGNQVPAHPRGWISPPGTSVSFSVPHEWKAGRIWGRRDCDFSKPGEVACVTGSCIGGLECDPNDGTGIPPVTVAEWTLGGGDDNYDVSVVDGFNIPMTITTSEDCPTASCETDLNPDCPEVLRIPGGCKSACLCNLDGNKLNSPNCCTGSFNQSETCPMTGVAYYDYFKKGCKSGYVYAYDETSGTALWTCPTQRKTDYTLTFCPTEQKEVNEGCPASNQLVT
ncbi:thaumatin-like protein [Infundibulicybe gibba]|nr:thaumatin-like protein [Infundibulicybe gibba]